MVWGRAVRHTRARGPATRSVRPVRQCRQVTAHDRLDERLVHADRASRRQAQRRDPLLVQAGEEGVGGPLTSSAPAVRRRASASAGLGWAEWKKPTSTGRPSSADRRSAVARVSRFALSWFEPAGARTTPSPSGPSSVRRSRRAGSRSGPTWEVVRARPWVRSMAVGMSWVTWWPALRKAGTTIAGPAAGRVRSRVSSCTSTQPTSTRVPGSRSQTRRRRSSASSEPAGLRVPCRTTTRAGRSAPGGGIGGGAARRGGRNGHGSSRGQGAAGEWPPGGPRAVRPVSERHGAERTAAESTWGRPTSRTAPRSVTRPL